MQIRPPVDLTQVPGPLDEGDANNALYDLHLPLLAVEYLGKD